MCETFLSSVSKGWKSIAPCNAVSKACISLELRVYTMGLLGKGEEIVAK